MERVPLALFAIAAAGWLASCTVRPDVLRGPSALAQARENPARYLVITVRNDPQSPLVTPGSTPRDYGAGGIYGVSAAARATAHTLERDYRLREVAAWPIETLRVDCIVVRMPPEAIRAGLIARLRRDSRVDSAQPLNQFSTQVEPAIGATAQAPRPPAADAGSYVALQHNLTDLGVLAAQRLSRGAAVRIAVIDTGIDYRHPDLRGRIVERRNFVADSRGDFARDRHGTEVAGLIAASGDAGGAMGIAPASHLIALKACWPLRQGGAQAVCNSFTLAQALEAAIDARADVVNLSLAGPPDPLLSRLVRQGMRRGIIYVGAIPPAPSAWTRSFPDDIAGVLPVQSAEDAGGKGDPRQLLAPGHDILTLVPGGHYDFASGSSLATAEVTGIVALLIAGGRRLPVARVDAVLEQSSRRFASNAGIFTSVNACAALANVISHVDCGDPREVSRRSHGTPPLLESEKPMQLHEVQFRVVGVHP